MDIRHCGHITRKQGGGVKLIIDLICCNCVSGQVEEKGDEFYDDFDAVLLGRAPLITRVCPPFKPVVFVFFFTRVIACLHYHIVSLLP